MVRFIYKLLFSARGYPKLVEKQIFFSGNPQFIENAGKAIEFLEKTFPDFFQKIGSSEMLVLFHGETTFFDFKRRVFSVGKSYSEWGVQGLVAFLVYIFYRSKNAEKPESQTARWLKTQKFPAEIVEPFEKSALYGKLQN